MQVNHYKQLSGALDEISQKSHGHILVSKQVHPQGRRFFYVFPIDSFISYVEKTPFAARYFHEHIIPTRPVKLFFDIEDKSSVVPVGEFMHLIDIFITSTTNFANEFTPKPIRQCAVSCANREGCNSVHLTFDISFPNIQHMLVFKNKLMEVAPNLPFIDNQVYSATGVKSMRTMYSNKMICQFSNKRQFCLLPLNQPDDNVDFDTGLFSRSLITNIDEDCPIVTLPSSSISTPSFDFNLKIKVKPPEELYLKIQNWLENTMKCTHKLVSSSEHEFCLLVHPSFYCPIIGREHTSNGSHLFFKHYGSFVDMTIYCLGCNCISKYKQDILFIL